MNTNCNDTSAIPYAQEAKSSPRSHLSAISTDITSYFILFIKSILYSLHKADSQLAEFHHCREDYITSAEWSDWIG